MDDSKQWYSKLVRVGLALVLLCIVSLGALLSSGAVQSGFPLDVQGENRPANDMIAETLFSSSFLLRLQDTVFVAGDRYVAISLADQVATVVSRNGRTDTFRISSGNPRIPEGMTTPSGLFTVQNKTPMAVSRQFDNARLHWWVGFNGDIGFHGLDGNGYYHHLGKRPSSHGCVRIGRQDGQRLYGLVEKGTPVIVYRDTPARVLAFDNASKKERDVYYIRYNDESANRYFDQRLAHKRAPMPPRQGKKVVVLERRAYFRRGGVGIGSIDTVVRSFMSPPVGHGFVAQVAENTRRFGVSDELTLRTIGESTLLHARNDVLSERLEKFAPLSQQR